MEYQFLGRTGLRVSAFCLGTDAIGSRVDVETSFRVLDRFAESGGNFIDTANFYAAWLPDFQGGESEKTIGRWMAERGNRDELVIDTKLGFDYPGCEGGLSATEIEKECEKSLRRLQTDRIDVYYAHRDDSNTPLDETMEAMDRLVRSGKVRAIGASNLKGWRIAEANQVSAQHGWPGYTVIQQRHTYLRPRHGADFGPQICINDDLKDLAATREIALVGYSTLLQGAYTRSDRPIPPQYTGPESDQRLATLSEIAEESGATIHQTILAWMRQSSPPVLPIIAGSDPDQLDESIQAVDVTLSPAQIDRLDSSGSPQIEQAWIR